jgi:uncharacterized membrane protein
MITPLGEPTNELLARTKPTLLDVMVAFFGGVAGIVSISRTDKSNAIPGVAIATALMPPLCTAGYGLALGRFDFFFGGFYLFFHQRRLYQSGYVPDRKIPEIRYQALRRQSN